MNKVVSEGVFVSLEEWVLDGDAETAEFPEVRGRSGKKDWGLVWIGLRFILLSGNA